MNTQGRPTQPPNVSILPADHPMNMQRGSNDNADHIFSYQLSFPRNIRAEVRIYGSDLRKADIVRLQKEVGDLAGAFDEDVTEVEPTQ